MSQKRQIAVIGVVSVLLLAGVSYAVWKATLASHQAVSVEKIEGSDDESNADRTSDNYLNEEKARFKNKSGVEVSISSYAECEACEAPEFLAIQTEADSQMNSIPSPQEHNFSESTDAHMKTTIVYGRCSDDVVVYQEITSDKAKPEAKGPHPGVTFQKFIASVLPSGQVKIKKEGLTQQAFEKAFREPATSGCEVLRQDDTYTGGT